jgi:uncharacterized protein
MQEERNFDTVERKEYHNNFMSEQAVINTVAFARAAETREGWVAVSELQRLGDQFSNNNDSLHYVIRGSVNQDRDPVISLDVEGSVDLICQRCLNTLQVDLRISKCFRMVADEALVGDICEEDENVETLVAPRKIDVREFVEDEIILSLPFAPTHGDCKYIERSDNPVLTVAITRSL